MLRHPMIRGRFFTRQARWHGSLPPIINSVLAIITAAAILGVFIPPARAEVADQQEMEQVCRNFISERIALDGVWAGDNAPEIAGLTEIRCGDTLLANCYHIAPRGFVLVSALKEMVPVKAYSDESDLDEKQEGGFRALITELLTDRTRRYVAMYGSLEATQPPEGEALFGRGQRQVWNKYAVSSREFAANLSATTSTEEQVGPLVTSTWIQLSPYNDYCPMGDGGRCVTGCVATAAAQIMAYWQYPAAGLGSYTYYWNGDNSCGTVPINARNLSADFSDEYDWANIPQNCSGGCTEAQQQALAELNYEVGVAFEMDYGYCGSGSYVPKGVQAFPKFFRYSPDVRLENRISYDLAGWYNLLKAEIDAGRPALYRIKLHAIVMDGYRDTQGQYEYHMNYGWGDAFNTWFVLDSLFCYWIPPDSLCPADSEYVVVNIHPQTEPVLSFVGAGLTEGAGDGDGHADAGETVRVAATIENNGVEAVNPVGNVTAAGPYVTIAAGTAAFDASIAWGDQSSTATPFEVTIQPDCPDPFITWIEITASSDGGFSVIDTVLIFVGDTPGFSDDMELGEGFWKHSALTQGYVDQWHQESYRSHSSSWCWKAGGIGSDSYSDFHDGALVTPPFLLAENSTLRFWHWYSLEPGDPGLAWDGGIVMISSVDGLWTQITPVGGYRRTIIDNGASPFEAGTPCYSGDQDWTEAEFDLSAYSGVVRIMFRLGSDGAASQEGWYIDDIEVTGHNTAVGTPSLVEPMAGCMVTFDQVNVSGNTSITTGTSGPILPAGHQPLPADPPTYWQISTTAGYEGGLEICLPYDATDIVASENKIKLLRYDGSDWEDVTSSIDTVANTVCGMTDSLGTFLIAEKLGCCLPPTVGDVDQSGYVDITDVSVLIDNQFLTLTSLICDAEGDLDFSGAVDVTDISILIDNQFLTLAPLSPCP